MKNTMIVFFLNNQKLQFTCLQIEESAFGNVNIRNPFKFNHCRLRISEAEDKYFLHLKNQILIVKH